LWPRSSARCRPWATLGPDIPPEPAQRWGKPVRQAGKVSAPDVHVGRHDSQRRHPLLPTDYDQYFRVIAVTSSGRNVALTQVGKTYYIGGKPLRVVGLANLGRKEASYDACYTEVRNNYIDIVLDGSEAAARRITTVEIPSTGRYKPLYNPGGPRNDPARRALQRAKPADFRACHHRPE
jgi:hypothetical protein